MRVYTEGQEGRPTLGEVTESRPPRGSGAPLRARRHYDRILALLRERGPSGVLSSELYDAPHLFGRSPRNRISELRKHGHLIKTVPAGTSVVRYVLTHENPAPPPHKPQPRKAEQTALADSADWFEREHGPRAAAQPPVNDLPLFQGVRS